MARTIIALLLLTTSAFAEPVIVITQPMDTPQTVVTTDGIYVIVPNYSTGQPQAIVCAVGCDKDKDKE